MAIDKRLFIYATFLISCGAVALTVTAFATQAWISGEMQPVDITVQIDRDVINYGLFSGTLVRKLFSTTPNFNLYITCLTKENACVWSCNLDSEARVNELELLLYNGTFTFRGCSSNKKLTPKTYREGPESYAYSKRINRLEKASDQQYINAALRLSTIVFLSASLLFAVIGAVFAVINSAMTPIELITGIFGLYIWNAVALISGLIVLILWGAHFATTLTNNVAYTESVSGSVVSKGLVKLGYSYWCVLGATILHAANLSLLGVRQVLINKEPVQKTVEIEANDGDIFLY